MIFLKSWQMQAVEIFTFKEKRYCFFPVISEEQFSSFPNSFSSSFFMLFPAERQQCNVMTKECQRKGVFLPRNVPLAGVSYHKVFWGGRGSDRRFFSAGTVRGWSKQGGDTDSTRKGQQIATHKRKARTMTKRAPKELPGRLLFISANRGQK